MTLEIIAALNRKLGRPAIRVVEVETSVLDSYKGAIRLCTDWDLLAELTMQYSGDARLTEEQREELDALADSRDLTLRPFIQADTVHGNTHVPERTDAT